MDTEPCALSNAEENESQGFKVPSLVPVRPKPQSEKSVAGAERSNEEDGAKQPPLPLPYNEPAWSSLPPEPYTLTVIKHGTIIEEIPLSKKPFHVFGRVPSCDIQLDHPSISRFHAVLQYRPQDESSESRCDDAEGNSTLSGMISSSSVSVNPKEEGFYVFDLGSTHGTCINKTKIQTRCYYRLRIGQMIKFGGSSRLFLLEVSSSVLVMLIPTGFKSC